MNEKPTPSSVINENIKEFIDKLDYAQIRVLIDYYKHIKVNGIMGTIDYLRYNEILTIYIEKFSY